MKIGLIAVDSNHPNLALMRLSAYHKAQGDEVEWYNAFEHYDVVYMSKIFNFTPDYGYIIANADKVVKGGTGYDLASRLQDEVEGCTPDYTIYPSWPNDTALGFLTRGCPNRCPWCVVPRKEGNKVYKVDTLEHLTEGGKRKKVVLMDNNPLAAPDLVLSELEWAKAHGVRLDFNQALDARLVNDDLAKVLAGVRWIDYIRFGCDTKGQIEHCVRAIELLRAHGYKGEIMLYTMLHGDFYECFNRVDCWHEFPKVYPHAQPFRDPLKPNTPPQWQQDMARWCNRREFYKTTEFQNFEPRKGFFCREYFK